MKKFTFFSFMFLFAACGPKIDTATVTQNLAHQMCEKMGSCSQVNGSAFGMDICMTGLKQAYTGIFEMMKKTSVPQKDYEACLAAVGKLACDHAQMSYWPDECGFMKNK